MSEQYTYAVARIRALEVGLFSGSTIEQLIACQDYGQCLQFLEEKGWGDSESSGNAEAMLTREEEKIWEVVKDLHIDMEHFAVLSYPKIFHNLKAAVKEACTGAKIQHIYYEDVQIPGSVMSEIVREKEFGRLPAYMQHAIRKKKDSSIVVGMKLVKEGRADAFVSAGSTGAVLVGGQVIVGRIKGVERPALAPLFPTEKGVSLLIDCGANVDARPSHLVQFAKMGTIYMEHVVGTRDPKAGIVNIGAEEEKGNALVKETFPLLKEEKSIHFIGSVEARDIPRGAADVVVCEAFAGNIILKLFEGVGNTLIRELKKGMMKDLRSKIGALLVKPALKDTLKKFDTAEYGGAPLLGLNGLVVKTHGSSKAVEISNTLVQCVTFKQQKINEKIKESIQAGGLSAE